MPPTQAAAVAVPIDSSESVHPAIGAGLIGSTLGGRFIVEARLGPGESGDYHSAMDLGNGGLRSALGVVVKIAHTAAGDAEALEAFRDEYNQARRLSNPNIARVYDFIAEPGEVGYTLDLPPGASLADRIPEPLQGRLARDYAWALIAATGRALVHAHLRDVVHGALSVRSLWLTDERQLRLLEFGSRPVPQPSRPGEPPLPRWSADVARYASCEVLEGHAPSASDDLYSLSCLAYELLAGRHPCAGADATTARDQGMRLVRPPGLKSFEWRPIQDGLCLSRKRRPTSVREWLAALRLALKDERLPELSVVPMPAASGHGREVVLAVTGLAALGCSLWVWQSRRHEVPSPTPVSVMSSVVATPTVAVTPTSPVDEIAQGAVARRSAAAVTASASPTAPPAAVTATSILGSAKAHERSIPIGGGLWFSRGQYTVAGRSRFVEVHVLRRGSAGEAGFQWWTEADTARAGDDFQPQAPALQTLRAGASGTSLFVRIPESKMSRRHFRVCAQPAPASGGSAPACIQILL